MTLSTSRLSVATPRITYDLTRPVAVGAMLGEVAKEEVVLTSGARPGDAIVITKGVAI